MGPKATAYSDSDSEQQRARRAVGGRISEDSQIAEDSEQLHRERSSLLPSCSPSPIDTLVAEAGSLLSLLAFLTRIRSIIHSYPPFTHRSPASVTLSSFSHYAS